MSNIRVTYSGLISFLVSLISLITGTIFVIIVTRKLSPDELGLWALINSVVGYVLIVDPIISYWSTRQIARGEKLGKTTLFGGSIFSITGSLVFLIISFFISDSLSVNFEIFLLATILVPLSFIHASLSGITLGEKPHVIQYGLLAFESIKIPLGFVFVVFYQMGIEGAILTIILSEIIRSLVLFSFMRRTLSGKIYFKQLKLWLRKFWLPLYASIPGFIISFDIVVFSIITLELEGIAYWTAAGTVASLIVYSGNISQALYPKVISTLKKEFVEQSFRLTMYFAIPLFCLTIVFAKSLLHIINPIYADGSLIVIFMALKSFIVVITIFSFNTMRAYEKVDKNENASFMDYIKSNLFYVPSLLLVRGIVYIVSLSAFLIFAPSQMDILDLVIIWSVLSFIIFIPFSFIGLNQLRKSLLVHFSIFSILKYLLAGIIASGIILILQDQFLEYKTKILDFLPEIFPLLIIWCVIYLAITIIWDKKTKDFVKSIISEIKK